jgi:hypothetical protein
MVTVARPFWTTSPGKISPHLQILPKSPVSHAGGYPTIVNHVSRQSIPPFTQFTKISVFTCWPLADGHEPAHPTRYPLNYTFNQKSPISHADDYRTVVNHLTWPQRPSITKLTKFIQISLFTCWLLPDRYEPPHPTTETLNYRVSHVKYSTGESHD